MIELIIVFICIIIAQIFKVNLNYNLMIDYRGHMEKYLFIKNQIIMGGLLFGGFVPMLYAATERTQQVVELPTIQVIGSQKDSILKIPGAAVIVSQ